MNFRVNIVFPNRQNVKTRKQCYITSLISMRAGHSNEHVIESRTWYSTDQFMQDLAYLRWNLIYLLRLKRLLADILRIFHKMSTALSRFIDILWSGQLGNGFQLQNHENLPILENPLSQYKENPVLHEKLLQFSISHHIFFFNSSFWNIMLF
jgi:hypothetical protein